MFSYIKNYWLSISLKKKLGTFSLMVILVMGVSIALNLLVMNFSTESLDVILNDNALCYDVQESMEHEAEAFRNYIRERTWESAKDYRLACIKTESSLSSLPFDYEAIGQERYARTWNVKNGYEGYQSYRDQVVSMNPGEPEYVKSLYQVYDMQKYLQTYARRLMQSTLKEGRSSYQEKAPQLYNLPYMIMAYSALMIAAVIFMTRVLSGTLVNPLVKLAHSSREIAGNNFSGGDLMVENQDEMGELVQAFNKMKHSTERYINTLKEKNEMAGRLHKEEVDRINMEKRMEAARLELLKSQINPHFLFNTLNMISCTAKLEEAKTTERMISSLGNLFRYNLKITDQTVPLEQELKAAQDYMYIQQMRFGSRVQYECHLEVDAAGTLIPSFTLQPLVENAVIHGVARKEEGGRVILKVRKNRNHVIMSLADTGAGMDKKTLEQLSEDLKGYKTSRIGIGLGNIYQRIKCLYEGGDLRIYSRLGKGTAVLIILPCEEDAGSQRS
ncbi:sensor histidine kinase [Lacrimispora sp.]|uniref:sensor histidine kinase n=1 Tax=Lacrimispora sp. TaxID=2719234 RepID=UPI003460E592